jgi:hypothetical protein
MATMTMQRTPAITNGAVPKLTRFSKSGVVSPRIVLNATEGWGKTSFSAFAPNPAILMARGESGFATLRQSNRVPDCDAVELSTWPDVLKMVSELKKTEHQTVAFDAMGGFERLCHEFVCNRDFGGDWGEKGFSSFGRGPDVSCAEWIKLLSALDELRASRAINVIVLSHAKVKPFKNPLGADFDRYVADCHEKTWGLTHKWADLVLFGQFVTVTAEDRKTKRVKGIGGTERVAFTQRCDAYDAKNRYGMPDRIEIGDEAKSTWGTIWNTMTGTAESVEPTENQVPEL